MQARVINCVHLYNGVHTLLLKALRPTNSLHNLKTEPTNLDFKDIVKLSIQMRHNIFDRHVK